MNILAKIVEQSKLKLVEQKTSLPLFELKKIAQNTIERPSFKKAFENPNSINIIAELKKASPSKGLIRENFDVEFLASQLEQNGAKALSILTEENYFYGSLDYLERVAKLVNLPLLRKDFIYDEYQIYQAKVAGASAILLIVAMLKKEQIQELSKVAKELNLDILLEVHSKEELQIALEVDAEIIGVNARNLATFETSLDVSMELIKLIPDNKIIIAESAITNHDDILKLQSVGAKGFLIGETIMRNKDVGKALKGLLC